MKYDHEPDNQKPAADLPSVPKDAKPLAMLYQLPDGQPVVEFPSPVSPATVYDIGLTFMRLYRTTTQEQLHDLRVTLATIERTLGEGTLPQ